MPSAFHAIAQRGRVHSEELGCPGRSAHSPAALFEGCDQVLALEILQGPVGQDSHLRLARASTEGISSRARRRSGKRLFQRQARGPGEDHGSSDHVLELTDVAGPRMTFEQRSVFRREDERRAPELRAYPPQEEARKGQDVFRPLAQRRQMNRENTQPVEQIATEPARLHLRLEVAVARGDHPNVCLEGAIVADALELALLQDAQQLRLHVERDFTHLVQEQGSTRGELEAAHAVAMRAGERPLHVTEELALEELVRDRSAIHLHERLLRALASAWIARATSSFPCRTRRDEHARLRRRDGSDEREHLPERRALAHEHPSTARIRRELVQVLARELGSRRETLDLPRPRSSGPVRQGPFHRAGRAARGDL